MSIAKTVGGLVVGLVAGGAGGLFGGVKLGRQEIVSQWIGTEAARGAEVVAVLEKMQAKDPAAQDELEVHLNRHLFGLMPSTLEPWTIDPALRAQIDQSAGKARAYRAAHPRPATTILDKDVEAFLASIAPPATGR